MAHARKTERPSSKKQQDATKNRFNVATIPQKLYNTNKNKCGDGTKKVQPKSRAAISSKKGSVEIKGKHVSTFAMRIEVIVFDAFHVVTTWRICVAAVSI